MSFTNCTREEAESALAISGGDVVKATEALFAKPVVAGDKYVAKATQKVALPHDAEQEERCAAGRGLMDKLSVVFSGAHRKILEQTPPAEPAASAQPASLPEQQPQQNGSS